MGDFMFAVERLRLIQNYINDNGKVDVGSLSRMLGVSHVTIRRDLEKLENSGVIQRTHGGAVLNQEDSDANFAEMNDPDLREIGTVAARFVKDGDGVCLTGGPASLALAQALSARKSLTILTNDIQICALMADMPGKKIILLGGEYDSENKALFGALSIENLARFRVSMVFLEVDGIDAQGTYSVKTPEKAAFLKAAFDCAPKRVILCPAKRFGHGAFYNLGSFDQYSLITNASMPAVVKQKFFDDGIPVFTSVNFDDLSREGSH
jgi:DeoR/GlpR family transcriptional regulator of sugar metabolism